MGGDVDDVVDRAQAAVYEVVERRTSEDYIGLEAAMWETYNEIEAIGNRGGELFGVPTGFRDLDELTNGLHAGQLIVVAGRPGLGKALALDTPLATPSGWTTMGEVEVGDQLIGADGMPTTVVAATEVMTGRPCFEIHFDDGSVVVADGEHQWRVDVDGAGARCLTTRAVALVHGRGQRCIVANARAVDLPARELLIPPYALGVWLGAAQCTGPTTMSTDFEVAMYLEAAGVRVCPGDTDAAVATTNNGRVPACYLRASIAQRRELLAGLLDVNGTVHADGVVSFETCNPALCNDLLDLAAGLGHRVEVQSGSGSDGETDPAFRIRVAADEDLFRVERKRLAHKEARQRNESVAARAVVAVRAIDSVPVRCVQVDNSDHMYLAGRSMIPTHNSTLGMDFLRSASISHNQAGVMFSLEMGKSEITMRLLSAEARIPLTRIRTGTLTDDDWNKLARRMGEVAQAPMFIDDSPNLTMMEIRAKARRLKQRHDLRLVVVDYLQLMTSPKRVENRQQEVAEMSRSLKLLAKELGVPVVAISQLNRGAEQRSDKKPQLSDLRESGAIEQDADMVMFVYRDEYYNEDSDQQGLAEVILAKNRNGPTGAEKLAFLKRFAKFADLQSAH
jgi:replicative DNA helicase